MNQQASQSCEVFISYSTPDKKMADAACAVLERHRIRCWIAPRDILPGVEYGAAIVESIRSCKVFVLIFSGHANESGHVRREVELAISSGSTILPFRVEDILPAGAMAYALNNTHWLDAFTPPVEEKLEKLAESVQTLVGRPSDAHPWTSARRPLRRRLPTLAAIAALVILVVGLATALIQSNSGLHGKRNESTSGATKIGAEGAVQTADDKTASPPSIHPAVPIEKNGPQPIGTEEMQDDEGDAPKPIVPANNLKDSGGVPQPIGRAKVESKDAGDVKPVDPANKQEGGVVEPQPIAPTKAKNDFGNDAAPIAPAGEQEIGGGGPQPINPATSAKEKRGSRKQMGSSKSQTGAQPIVPANNQSGAQPIVPANSKVGPQPIVPANGQVGPQPIGATNRQVGSNGVIEAGSRVNVTAATTAAYADATSNTRSRDAGVLQKGSAGTVIKIGDKRKRCCVRLDDPAGVDVWILTTRLGLE